MFGLQTPIVQFKGSVYSHRWPLLRRKVGRAMPKTHQSQGIYKIDQDLICPTLTGAARRVSKKSIKLSGACQHKIGGQLSQND